MTKKHAVLTQKRPILTPFQRENRKIQGVGQKRKVQQTLEFTGLFWRRGWDSNPCAIARKLISSLVRTWYFRVCCGRWRQFWKRRKSLCCNGFRTHRPVLTSSISEKTRVQIEMRNAPKRSIFCTLARKYARRKPLSGMVLQTAPRIKCKKNRLKTDYTKRPFGPKHRKESSL